jgi:hypothetical protein
MIYRHVNRKVRKLRKFTHTSGAQADRTCPGN